MLRTVLIGLIVAIPLFVGCSKIDGNVDDKLVLPPPEIDCVSDNDCSVPREHYIEGNACCSTCTPLASNKTWARKYVAECQKLGDEGCKMKKCAAVDDPHCVAGKCVLPEKKP